jgi:DNA repair protein RecN (Recombination protein N)
MLTLIRVANYAIIDEVELELDAGLSVMTGETGAGKSILVDAVALALGDRADATAVRQGAKRAEISAVFECPDGHPALEWLRERDLDSDNSCCVRRLIAAEGRSRAFINNQPVTLQDLKSLGAMLIDIHGQHAHQSLLNPGSQRRMLDASADAEELAEKVRVAYRSWREAAAELDAQSAGQADRDAKLDLIRFQLSELNELALEPGEVQTLIAERALLGNVDRVLEGISVALLQSIDADGGGAHSQIVGARQAIETIAEHDPALADIAERLAAAEIELKEACTDLARYRDKVALDPKRLEDVTERLDRIRRLARRHRVDDTELIAVVSDLEAELAEFESGSNSLEALGERASSAKKLYIELATTLSAKRQSHAATLSYEVSEQLKQLGMPHGEFVVAIESRDESKADASGLDDVEFRVQINPGQPFAPLSRAASGGELSRISLALEVIASGTSPIPTYIFDEVDAGIGGGVAEIVGRRLREIAQQRQVLCVTHLPQVASQGNNHYRIVKLTDGKTSRTQIRRLDRDERIEELSRMLGGVKITQATRAHAAEMVEQSEAIGTLTRS